MHQFGWKKSACLIWSRCSLFLKDSVGFAYGCNDSVDEASKTIHQALKDGNLDKSCINHFVKTYQPTHCVQVSRNMWRRCCGIHDGNDQGTDWVLFNSFFATCFAPCGGTPSVEGSVFPFATKVALPCAAAPCRQKQCSWCRYVVEINIVHGIGLRRTLFVIEMNRCRMIPQISESCNSHKYFSTPISTPPPSHLRCICFYRLQGTPAGSIGPSLPLSFGGLGGLRIQAGTGGEVAYLMRSLGPSCHGLHGVQCVLHTFGESWYVSHHAGTLLSSILYFVRGR